MPEYIALLRGVNVGMRNRVKMADLRTALDAAGLKDVQTLLQSGNVVFSAEGTPAELETRLETISRDALNLDVAYFVRSADEWKAILTANPFPKMAESDPAHLQVFCFRGRITAAHVDTAWEGYNGPEEAVAVGRELYVTFPEGIGTSKLFTRKAFRILMETGTGRNWSTAIKISELLN